MADTDSLSEALLRIHAQTEEQFVIIIDEWDCLFREEKENTEIQEKYINFLRGIFKGVIAESAIRLAYITGRHKRGFYSQSGSGRRV